MTSTRFPRLWYSLGPAAMLIAAGCTWTQPPSESASAADAAPCPSVRQTPRAPESVYTRENPLAATPDNIDAGKRLYQSEAKPIACASCHGVRGKGGGPIGRHLQPPPTNFTCTGLLESVPDGQFFWVIKEGSGFVDVDPGHGQEQIKRPGRRERSTAMRPHKYHLRDEQIWQLVLYIRTFAE